MLRYLLQPTPKSHQWHIELHFKQENNTSACLSLANWVPGSYMIRDFSRHIIDIHAECNGRPALLTQTAKNRWQTEASAGAWRICYTVYAFDLSVRGAYLNNERAFFDGACLFLKLDGRETEEHHISLTNLPDGWRTATTLPALSENQYHAPSYAELIDHPFELGRFETLDFTACGIDHQIVLSGHYADFDRPRLLDDVRRICEAELKNFPSPAPFTHYSFLLFLGDNVYGGLEHRSSTALMADRKTLPAHGTQAPNEDYTLLLGLIAHEYFHAWNVKSIKPAAFEPYNLEQESHTEQLWAFEGITSYYDDLFLARSGVISPQAYLKLLADNLSRVQQGHGRHKQTLAQSSFTAWTKYYKQDENSPNAIVSYYQKGALAALCLDLTIRLRSHGKTSLDHIMQALYQDWQTRRCGLAENEWQQRAQEITGLDLHDFFQTALFSTDDLPLQECLAHIGVELRWLPAERGKGGQVVNEFPAHQETTDFGARFKQHADHISISHVFHGGSAETAGLSAHDRIIALNGFQCSDFAGQWSNLNIGEHATLHYFRHGHLQQTELVVQAAAADTAFLKITDETRLQQWLGH